MGLERSGEQKLLAWPRALGLPSGPTSPPARVCLGLDTERTGRAPQTRECFSGITSSPAGPNPSVLLHLGLAQLFSTPDSPKSCLFYLLGLPGSFYFSPGCLFSPTLSQPHSSLPCPLHTPCCHRAFALAVPSTLQILDLESGLREASAIPSHLTAGFPAVAWPLFKSDWHCVPTPFYSQRKRKIGRPGAGWQKPQPHPAQPGWSRGAGLTSLHVWLQTVTTAASSCCRVATGSPITVLRKSTV